MQIYTNIRIKIKKLEENTINYIIKEDEETRKEFKEKNNYTKYLEISKKNNNKNKIIAQIKEKLNILDEEELKKILNFIKEIENSTSEVE